MFSLNERIKYLEKSAAIKEKQGGDYQLAQVYYEIADAYKVLNNRERADQYFHMAYSLREKICILKKFNTNQRR